MKYRIREFRAFRSLDHKTDNNQKKLEIDIALVRKELEIKGRSKGSVTIGSISQLSLTPLAAFGCSCVGARHGEPAVGHAGAASLRVAHVRPLRLARIRSHFRLTLTCAGARHGEPATNHPGGGGLRVMCLANPMNTSRPKLLYCPLPDCRATAESASCRINSLLAPASCPWHFGTAIRRWRQP